MKNWNFWKSVNGRECQKWIILEKNLIFQINKVLMNNQIWVQKMLNWHSAWKSVMFLKIYGSLQITNYSLLSTVLHRKFNYTY